MKENNWYVYRHTKKGLAEVFYIGIGSSKNFKRSKTYHGRNNFWNNVVKKYGFDSEIVTTNRSLEEAKEIEKILISWYKRIDCCEGTLVNLTDGGEGTQNIIVSKETKEKLSKANKGKKLLQSTKDKISNYQKERKKSEEFCLNMSKIHKGKKVPIEVVLRMIASKTGVSNPHKKIPILQFDKKDVFIRDWESISDACNFLGLSNSAVSNNLKGLSNYCGGFKFKYK